MRILLTIIMLLFTPPDVEASELDDATGLLSRYPQGRVPTSVEVVDAIATLAGSGTDDHMGLLDSLIEDESMEIRMLSEAALNNIVSRSRRKLRDNFHPPSLRQVDDFSGQFAGAKSGSKYGRHERQALA